LSSEQHTTVVYATASSYKQEEVEIFQAKGALQDGTPVESRVEFSLRQIEIKETLEVDLEVMVRAEAVAAYKSLLVPCIVEHAGLVFDHHRADGYPGGLTKPMWNTLGEAFPSETGSAGRGAVARAVVGYCDGQHVKTFVGETHGQIADAPRGERAFYWDTIFVPDRDDGTPGSETYAEIVAVSGLETKVLSLSQSAKAMRLFLAYRLSHAPALWPAR
jgi:inosine/xanthosine triphosphate pyrophosphatase family protein